jgi:hypothetical protein
MKMKSDVKKARKLIHDLSNRMIVINKAFEIFSSHLPAHRITTLGLNSLDNVLVIIRDLKEVIATLEENTPDSLISTNKLSEYIVSQKMIFEEMCIMKLDIDISKSNSEHVDIPKEEISNLFGLFLEDSALTSATEVKVQIYATNSCFRISLNDDGDGTISKDGENFNKIKESLLKFEAKSNLRSITDVGSSLIIDIPYAKAA